jgi:hypothetical protein
VLLLLMPDAKGVAHFAPPIADPFIGAVVRVAGPFAIELELSQPSNPPDEPPGAPLLEDGVDDVTREHMATLLERAGSDLDGPIRWGRAIPERGEERARLVFATARALLALHQADVRALAAALWESSAMDAEAIAPLLPRRSEETNDDGGTTP